MENLEKYLAAIDELVVDENKLVTYKLICNQLALCVTKAKKILQLYAKNNSTAGLTVTYSLIGKTVQGLKISLVRDVDLEKTKSSYSSITSCLAYSVQMTKLNDPGPLYNADYDIIKSNLFKCASHSAVRFHGAKPLSEEDMKTRRDKWHKVVATTTDFNKTKSAPKKSNAASFFSNNAKEKQDAVKNLNGDSENIVKDEKALENESNKTIKKIPKKVGGINTFMTKGKTDLFASKPKVSLPQISDVHTKASVKQEAVVNESTEETSINNKSLEKKSADKISGGENIIGDSQPDTMNKENIKKSNKAQKRNQGKKKDDRPKGKSRSNSGELPAKKRRRIQELSSSSDEESDHDFAQIDVIPPSPEPVLAKSSKVIKVGQKNTMKKRILKSKTFVDADGSMLTEKVWEEVCCSSGSEDEPTTKINEENIAVEKNAATKSISPKSLAKKKNKQASIIGFFAKKS